MNHVKTLAKDSRWRGVMNYNVMYEFASIIIGQYLAIEETGRPRPTHASIRTKIWLKTAYGTN